MSWMKLRLERLVELEMIERLRVSLMRFVRLRKLVRSKTKKQNFVNILFVINKISSNRLCIYFNGHYYIS